MNSDLKIMIAQKADVSIIFNLIKQFASENGSLDDLTGTIELLEDAMFGSEPACKVLLAYIHDNPVAYALYCKNFSTLLCKPGIYLVDIFVVTSARKLNVASEMLTWLANYASKNGYGRMEWSVRKDNATAINLYEKLGAKSLEDWVTYRMTNEEFANVELNALTKTSLRSTCQTY